MECPPIESTLILSTCPCDQAKELAHFLVKHRFAACVNLIPKITSIYSWKGELCEDQEALLFIKTAQTKVHSCIQALQEKHPYEVPEIISFPIDSQQSLEEYLQWIQSSTN